MNLDRKQVLPIALLLLSTVLQIVAYFPAMEGEFIADDVNLIVEKAAFFGDPGLLGQAFSEPYWVRTRESLPFYRPLVLATFFADRALWDFEPFGYHLTTLLLHLANGLFIYLLALQLSRSPWAAAIAALIFGLHPAHLTSVAWISGRTDLLAVFFLLPASALFIHGCRKEKGGWGWFAAAGLVFLLALLAKEVSLILLPFALVWLLGEGRLRSGWPRWTILAAAAAVYLAMRTAAGAFAVDTPVAAPLFQRLLTIPALLLSYLELFLWPADWSFAPWVELVSSAADWRLWAGLLACGATGTGLALLWRRNRPAAYGLVFMLLALLPVSGLVPLYAVMREWWAYTALAGLALALAPLAAWIFGRPGLTLARVAVAFLLAIFALVSTGVLHQRSGAFATAERFWHEAVERSPHYDIGWNYLGLSLQAEKKTEEAGRCFSRAVELRPDLADYANNLGLVHALQGRPDEAERLFRHSRDLDPTYEDPRANLGLLLVHQGRLDEAEPFLLEALRLEPDNHETLNSLATIHIRRREPLKAVDLVRRSLALNPRQGAAGQLRAFLQQYGGGGSQSR